MEYACHGCVQMGKEPLLLCHQPSYFKFESSDHNIKNTKGFIPRQYILYKKMPQYHNMS